MKDNEFQCDCCGDIFPKEWPEEETQKEYDKNFGHIPKILKENPASVCDNCYKALMAESDIERAGRTLRELRDLIIETFIEDMKNLWKWIVRLWRRIFKRRSHE